MVVYNGDSESRDSSSSSSDDDENDSISWTETGEDDDTNTMGDMTTNDSRKANEISEIEQLARYDTQMLRTWRIAVLLIIVGTFAAVTAGTCIFLKNQKENDDEQSYALFARTVQDSTARQFRDFTKVMSNMAESVTSASKINQENFPFVRVPMFELLGSQTRSLTGSEMIIWAPFVTGKQQPEWTNYSTANHDWYNESVQFVESALENEDKVFNYVHDAPFFDFVWIEGNQTFPLIPSPPPGPFAPIWQCSPPPFSLTFVNFDLMKEPYVDSMVPSLLQLKDGLMTSIFSTVDRLAGYFITTEDHEKLHLQYVRDTYGNNTFGHPHSVHLQPVFEELNDHDSGVVGFLLSLIAWDTFMANLLPEGVTGIVAVLHNTCDQNFTYFLDGFKTQYLGPGDLHDPTYTSSRVEVDLPHFVNPETKNTGGHCVYSLSLYRSSDFSSETESSDLILICVFAVSVAFVIMACTFFMYDRFVRRRNTKMVNAAARSNAILSSLFPSQIRDRLFAEKDENAAPKKKLKDMMTSGSLSKKWDENDDEELVYKSKPIADLFPETTILFADIAGFTAWSSVREPSQVFILLETLFRAFDDVARKRRVFKVETVGDCYVAVTGLPDPRKDHAIVMARFANDCMNRMQSLVKRLEVTLGPDTGDLSMRMGIHSGPVTAGVLRGERSRFQLFGDTMNTAARMEHTGLRDKIQLSQDTADLLIASGKTSWVVQRDDVVIAKGKGEMQTYWLVMTPANNAGSINDRTSSAASSDRSADQRLLESDRNSLNPIQVIDSKTGRLVEWNADVLLRLLKQIVARRLSCSKPKSSITIPREERFASNDITGSLDEVKEIITLPGFEEIKYNENPDDIVIDDEVIRQLRSFVTNIAMMYRANPFHSFEHASHVTMSVVKLLSRIVAPQQMEENSREFTANDISSTLHDHTYGITSDPLTQFSCVLSALIHDVDHPGVPNAQLVKEESDLATRYDLKSPAEQNSVDLAWNLLMQNQYRDLRATIYQTDAELVRFRQLVVNSVMATDIADKELKVLRNLRWNRAFSSTVVDTDRRDTINRKATIVIEHLIQASDVAHTMQHWHIYRKWNERFFLECYQAYLDGRAETNPADGWYEGEIGFFDYYIIPLAKKLKDCGVFGVSSDEYLNYAIRNRQEWETRGREVVNEMLELVKKSE